MRNLLVLSVLLSVWSCTSAQHRAVAVAGEQMHVDGKLDEAVWGRAPEHERFRQVSPYTGKPAPFRTSVRVAYDESALYVGIEAADPNPASIRAPRVRYDKVFRDQDFVVVYVDGVGTKAAAQWFRVGAGGGMADGVHTGTTDSEDFSPDFEWDGAATVHSTGYSAELRIPFSTLRFPRDSKTPWRVQVARRMPREQSYLFVSTEQSLESPNFIADMLLMEDFPGPRSEAAWKAGVTVTARDQREAPTNPNVGRELSAGFDLKLRPREGWVVDATFNPDFSQIELDVPQLTRNRQFALSVQEKRPFFLEGSDLAQTQTDTLYSRSISDPKWGLRTTYRGQALAGTLLSVSDRGGGTLLLPTPFSTGYVVQPASQASTSRLRWEQDGLSLGAIASNRTYVNIGYNNVLGPDAVWQVGRGQTVRAQALFSRTSALVDADGVLKAGSALDGHLVNLEWLRRSGTSGIVVKYRDVSEDFRNDNGLQTQNGFRRLKGSIDRQFRLKDSPIGEITPYLDASYSEARVTGEVISREIHPGVHLAGFRGLELDVEWRPREAARIATGAALHEFRQWVISFSMLPGSLLTQTKGEITTGERLDVINDRVRPGWLVSWSGRLRLGSMLEAEPSIEVGAIEGIDGRRAQYETASQLLSVLHLSAQDSLRLILQYTSFRYTPDVPQDPTFVERRTVGSLVYTHRKSSTLIYYIGATQARTRGSDSPTTLTELFAKVHLGF